MAAHYCTVYCNHTEWAGMWPPMPWTQQMLDSHHFFLPGGKGYSLADLGLEDNVEIGTATAPWTERVRQYWADLDGGVG